MTGIVFYSLGELALDPADILLEDLAVPDLLLHLTRLARIPKTGWRIKLRSHYTPEMELPAKHEEAGGEPVKPVDGPQVLQVVFLGQDEDHSVVAIAAAWVHLENRDTWSLMSSVTTTFHSSEGRAKSFDRLIKPQYCKRGVLNIIFHIDTLYRNLEDGINNSGGVSQDVMCSCEW